MAFKYKRLWRRCVLCEKMGTKICNSNLPLYFFPGHRKRKNGKKKKKTTGTASTKKAAVVSMSPSTVASGASGCDWPAPADSAGCAAAGECQEKRNSCLIIPPKCGAAGDTATRGLRNRIFCPLYSSCMFLFLGGFFGAVEEIRGKSRTDLSSEMVDFFFQNCRFLFFFTGADKVVIDVSEFPFHLLLATRWI